MLCAAYVTAETPPKKETKIIPIAHPYDHPTMKASKFPYKAPTFHARRTNFVDGGTYNRIGYPGA